MIQDESKAPIKFVEGTGILSESEPVFAIAEASELWKALKGNQAARNELNEKLAEFSSKAYQAGRESMKNELEK